MSGDVNIAFCRALLRQVFPDVRKAGVERVSDAWVYHSSTGDWEFHYKEFYWSGDADNAYDARYKGWCAYLRDRGVEAYQ